MTDLRDRIISIFNNLWEEDNSSTPPVMRDETILLETGMDSMGFAVFVAILDDELGFDPFTIDTEAVYPRTFGEFIQFYNKHAPNE
jgi:acyl carrier protein